MFIHDTKYRRDGEEYKPTYICDKCGRKITEYRPPRVVYQEYDRQVYRHIEHYDFCERCWTILYKWLTTKAKKKEDDNDRRRVISKENN